MYFDETDLNDDILDALDAMNFTTCTPIQEHSITPILEGHDLLGVAQTGTGKTAAYLLPILSRLSDGGYPHDAVNCVIMSPTRELAQQIDQAMQGFSYYVPVSSVAVYGGNDGTETADQLYLDGNGRVSFRNSSMEHVFKYCVGLERGAWTMENSYFRISGF